MARIKQILSERKVAYEQAYALGYQRQQAARQSEDGVLPELSEPSRTVHPERVEADVMGGDPAASNVVLEQTRIPS